MGENGFFGLSSALLFALICPLTAVTPDLPGSLQAKELLIKSILSFPRRRESMSKVLDPRLMTN
jgi:hypothetical protein